MRLSQHCCAGKKESEGEHIRVVSQASRSRSISRYDLHYFRSRFCTPPSRLSSCLQMKLKYTHIRGVPTRGAG
jgi:hypothetical protein